MILPYGIVLFGTNKMQLSLPYALTVIHKITLHKMKNKRINEDMDAKIQIKMDEKFTQKMKVASHGTLRHY